MEFGVHLPTYWPEYGSTDHSAAITETAVTAQTLGYTSIWSNDTIIVSPDNAWTGHVIEPLITLASLIHVVPHMHLGICVLVLPQRNAIIVAKQAAALSVLSKGRFILGIGSGWRQNEFRFLNADFSRRGQITDETIAVMRTLWQEDQANFHGQFYEFNDALFFPKPDQRQVPLWIGGNSPVAIRRASQVGDAWMPVGPTVDALKRGAQQLHHQSSRRKTPIIAAELTLCLRESGEQSLSSSAHISGSVEEIIIALKAFQRAGLEHLICDFEADNMDDLLRQMRLFAAEVMPHLVSRT